MKSGALAWNALMEVCKVKPGELVLCLGTGGVALAALKLARLHGARVAITSSSDEKLDIARQLGADITINYRTHPDWAAQVMALTNNTGAEPEARTPWGNQSQPLPSTDVSRSLA
ncbi:zinc-binding dehydrogenase [Pseudomonas savastanoi]|nr:zinc-binding dehydrogenase [Pseudomonas savastanoi]RMM61283.1 putative alcohol dehydrogenase [Pseudomonas savastanoi pv. glycinea]RMO33292.1 putative alcohol dehydrogenase [Pseudomonas savastanoi pv. glycinea]RMO38521.1 putative alcohol dehydrogenase [Pseudomonas savastanoi pv. glycinea]RMP55378.1 putative alcohol dehydrogenase [Pseudomonas savastanoi pv. glycinea]RMP97066.1 putative alcohol dehydrogenase [Pseudomonas savastanoi pv. glycinea]